jgi:hypothetical protein
MITEAAATIEQRQEVDLDSLIRDLDAGFDHLPEEALRSCQQHRELVIPRLIEVMQEAVRLGREGSVRQGNAHFFALFLLTEFQAKEALPVVLEALSLRDPVLDGLFGGAVTEVTRRVLATLAGDQPDLIESMILNRNLDDFIRWEAACALCQLVRDEQLSRAEAVERLARQLRTASHAEDWWGVTIVVCEIGELNPLEVQEEIKAAFDHKLVDESIIRWSTFENSLLKPDQPGVCPELSTWEPAAITDTVAELQTWHCFSDEAHRESGAAASTVDSPADEAFSENWETPGSVAPAEFGDGTVRRETQRVGRNDPCPCGSGKKFKKCCLRACDDH